jgi:hypothetical protein
MIHITQRCRGQRLRTKQRSYVVIEEVKVIRDGKTVDADISRPADYAARSEEP